MSALDRLSDQQRRFVLAVFTGTPAAQAYRGAGYKVRTDGAARANASRLLTNANVAAALAELRGAQQERAEVEADRLLAEIDLLALSDVGELLDFTGTEPRLRPANEISPAARRCVASIKVKRYTEGRGDSALEVEVTEFRLWNKLDALRLALQRRGLLKELHEHTGKDGRPIEFVEVAGDAPADRGSDPA